MGKNEWTQHRSRHGMLTPNQRLRGEDSATQRVVSTIYLLILLVLAEVVRVLEEESQSDNGDNVIQWIVPVRADYVSP